MSQYLCHSFFGERHAYDESGEFGMSLRLKIWSVALGIETDDPILDECPSSDAMFNHWTTNPSLAFTKEGMAQVCYNL